MCCQDQRPWREPPRIAPTPGARSFGGYSYVNLSNTELGKRVEHALAEHLGFTLTHPDRNTGPFDLACGDNVFEVKAVTRGAGEYKAKPKSHEVQAKRAAADKAGVKPHIMIAVVDADSETVSAYSKPGLGAFRLTAPKNGWRYHGTVPVSLAAA